MEPRIQYAKTSDGVNIAYWTLGEGPGLVVLPSLVAAGRMPLTITPERQRWYELLTTKWQVVHYDVRGSGVSDGSVVDLSLAAHVLDLCAVADAVGLQSFALLAPNRMGPVAIAYAAEYPDRVSHLILFCTAVRGADLWTTRAEAILRLADEDWELYTEVNAHDSLGWSVPEAGLAGRWAAAMRQNSSAIEVRRSADAANQLDAAPFVSQVSCPTLVLHRRQVRTPDMRVAGELASAIPGARLVLLEGSSPVPAVGDAESVAEAIDAFHAQTAAPATRIAELPSGMTAIVFADIADSTPLTEKMGDAAFRSKARELDGALRAAIRERGGTPVEGKVLGDGVMGVFTSAREAIEAGVRCSEAGASAGLPLHVGIHAGDVIREEGNVYGGAVNVASRIAGLSAAGEVLVSETVRSLARTSVGVRFEDRGEQELKGVGEAVRVWRVVAEDA